MNTRCCFLVVGLLILPFGTSAASTEEKAEVRIYSNVQYVEEGAGDLVGEELELTLRGSEATGNLRIYQGGCATPSTLRGTIVHGKLSLTGTDRAYAAGRIEIAGTTQGSTFEGILTLEKGAGPKKLRLKIISQPHCQG